MLIATVSSAATKTTIAKAAFAARRWMIRLITAMRVVRIWPPMYSDVAAITPSRKRPICDQSSTTPKSRIFTASAVASAPL